jgi:hypothetical protein
MSERRQRRWSWWVAKGAVAMATLAALSLAVTVLLAQRALGNAADVLVRGDGEALTGSVIVDLWQARWPVTAETLAPVFAKHDAQGLRYVALVDRHDHQVLAEAGSAVIAKPFDLPGELVRQGRRVRLVDALARLYARPGASERLPEPRPYLVVEF